MFLWNFSETVQKILKKRGEYFVQFFLYFDGKNLWKIIEKIRKILYGFCFLQECSYHSEHYDCDKYLRISKLQISWLMTV